MYSEAAFTDWENARAMDDEFQDEEEEEENLLLAQLVKDISVGSPFKKHTLASIPYLTPPRRGLEIDERSIAEEDEDLLARALFEEMQSKGSEGRSGISTPEVFRPMIAATPPRRMVAELNSEDDPLEIERMLDILRQASGERPINDENDKNGSTSSAALEELQALVRHLETRLKYEKRRADSAMNTVSKLYAHRFALAVICAASVPSLVFALLAHRYDLHEWEARSDAMGVLLVVIAVLLFSAIALWRKAKSQLETGHSHPQQSAGFEEGYKKYSSSAMRTSLNSAPRTMAVTEDGLGRLAPSGSQMRSISGVVGGGFSGVRRRPRRPLPSSTKPITKMEIVL